MVGPVENYTMEQIDRFATQRDGSKIPTLEEGLRTIIDETDLRLVWLDIKTPETTRNVAEVVRDARRHAVATGREVDVVAGLPLRPIYDAWVSTGISDIRALCELSPSETRSVDAAVWAPRWTLGLQLGEVEAMRAEGRRVFSWTIDVPRFIREFVDAGYDGILSNYPTLVAYYYYTRGSR